MSLRLVYSVWIAWNKSRIKLTLTFIVLFISNRRSNYVSTCGPFRNVRIVFADTLRTPSQRTYSTYARVYSIFESFAFGNRLPRSSFPIKSQIVALKNVWYFSVDFHTISRYKALPVHGFTNSPSSNAFLLLIIEADTLQVTYCVYYL